jgi:hypothetical protein
VSYGIRVIDSGDSAMGSKQLGSGVMIREGDHGAGNSS